MKSEKLGLRHLLISGLCILLSFGIKNNSFGINQLQQLNDSVPAPDSTMKVWGKEVTVFGQGGKKMTGTSVGKIALNPEAVSKLPSILGNTDLLKLLTLTPGIQNPGDGNTNMYIRGGDSGQNLLLYNGASLYTPGHLLGFFPLFNADHISSLELSKTGINAQYGGRLSSVITVKSKYNLPEKISIKGNVGLLSSQATLKLPLGKKFGLYLSGRKTYIELLMQPVLDATVNNNAKNKVENTEYNFYDTNLTLVGELSEKDRLTINAFFGKDNFNISDNDLLLNGILKWKNSALSAQWDTRIKSNKFSQQLLFSDYNNQLETSQAQMEFNLRSKIQDAGYKNKYSFFMKDIPFDAGLEYTHHKIAPQNYTINNAGQVYNTNNPETQNAHDAALFLSSKLRLSQRLSMDLGLRYNLFINKKTFNSLNPRISAFYILKDNMSIRAAYSRQNQYINLLTPSSVGIPTDMWIAASNDIIPQSGDEISAGYFQSFLNEAFEFSSEIYYRKMRNVTEYNQNFTGNYNNSFIDNIRNGNGRAYGIEFILKKNYGKLTGWISYTLGHSERTFDAINQGKTFPAKFDRRHDVSCVGAYTFNEHWDASVVYSFATGNAYTLPSSWYFINNTPVKEYGAYNGARMPDYNRTDFSINYWFKKDNGINFSLYNAFMVNNPVYIFMNVKQNDETGKIGVSIKEKKLYTIIPSISWRFKW